MAEANNAGDDFDHDDVRGYKPPEKKNLGDILNQDQDDEALKRYKEQLLGGAANASVEAPFPSDTRNVIVEKLALCPVDHPPIDIQLHGVDCTNLKKNPITIKEGSQYQVKIYFYVQRDIVTGLKYLQASYRQGIRVDKESMMMGSYGPKSEPHCYTTEMSEAPKGMLVRGKYTVKSKFTDDDNFDYLTWEWSFEVKKDWQ